MRPLLPPPMTREEFDEKNRRLLAGDRWLAEEDIKSWEAGRDWLLGQLTQDDGFLLRRRFPRLRLELPAHIAGVGRAVTDDIGFSGVRLAPSVPLTALREGDEASVRLSLFGRSIYVLGRVRWLGPMHLGVALDSVHPADERALQAAVLAGYLDRFAS
ncbi:MAG TPA: PilZ domain-containing protein [Anaeromyxobacteraceae bacterium]|nr:PilZ domain-containing protein [Anaeromyxobacteraceae bacterium]